MGAPFSFTGNVWSETAAMLGYGGGESITVPVSIKTMESSTPYMCAAIVFGLVLLYTLFIAVLMLFLNLAAGNMAGVILSLIHISLLLPYRRKKNKGLSVYGDKDICGI